MLVYLSKNDEAVNSALGVLKDMYPLEVVKSIDGFIISQGKVQLEPNGNLPTRISFVGHCDEKGTFGDGSDIEFSKKIIKELREAAKINPSIKNSLKTIDLIGCGCGLVSPEGKSVADTVAKQLEVLKKDGFNINVKALTNMTLEKPHPISTLFLSSIKHSNTFACYGFLSNKDYDEWTDSENKITQLEIKIENIEKEINLIKNKRVELLDEKKSITHKLENNLKNFNAAQAKLANEKEAIRTEIKKLENRANNPKKLEELKVKLKETTKKINSNIKKFDRLIDKTNNQNTECDAYLAKVDNAIETLRNISNENKQLITNEAKATDHIPIIVTHTPDIRKTLDSDPRNNFSRPYQQQNISKNQQSIFFKNHFVELPSERFKPKTPFK